MQLALTGRDSCGIRVDGSIICWGQNDLPGGPGPFDFITAGFSVCAIESESRRIRCFGPRAGDAPGGAFATVDCAGSGCCALSELGSATCWGDNGSNHNGVRGPLTAIALNALWGCGIADDGRPVCWGGHPSRPGENTPPCGN